MQQHANTRFSTRHNRFFTRFEGDPTSELIHITPTIPPSPIIEESMDSSTSEPQEPLNGWKKEFIQEVVTQFKVDIRTIFREELRAYHEVSHEDSHEESLNEASSVSIVSPPRILPRTEGEFVPFFNRKENATDRCKTVLQENGYLHIFAELPNVLREGEKPVLYVFGTEEVILPDFRNHTLTLFFKSSDDAHSGSIFGFLEQNKEGLYVIQIEHWKSLSSDMLYFTFEGGLL